MSNCTNDSHRVITIWLMSLIREWVARWSKAFIPTVVYLNHSLLKLLPCDVQMQSLDQYYVQMSCQNAQKLSIIGPLLLVGGQMIKGIHPNCLPFTVHSYHSQSSSSCDAQMQSRSISPSPRAFPANISSNCAPDERSRSTIWAAVGSTVISGVCVWSSHIQTDMTRDVVIFAGPGLSQVAIQLPIPKPKPKPKPKKVIEFWSGFRSNPNSVSYRG